MKKLYISESEKNEILKKHNSKFLSEDNQVAQQNYTITDLQNALIKTGKNPGTADGQFGPKTLGAIEQAIGVTSGTQGTPAATETPTTTKPLSTTSLETKKVTSLQTQDGKVTGVGTTNVGGGESTSSSAL